MAIDTSPPLHAREWEPTEEEYELIVGAIVERAARRYPMIDRGELRHIVLGELERRHIQNPEGWLTILQAELRARQIDDEIDADAARWVVDRINAAIGVFGDRYTLLRLEARKQPAPERMDALRKGVHGMIARAEAKILREVAQQNLLDGDTKAHTLVEEKIHKTLLSVETGIVCMLSPEGW